MKKNVRNFKGYNFDENKSNTKSQDFQKQVDDDVKEQFEKYSNFSQKELIDEFYKEAKKQKQDGNLNNQMLENFYQMMAPNMTSEQRAKMKQLINSVK